MHRGGFQEFSEALGVSHEGIIFNFEDLGLVYEGFEMFKMLSLHRGLLLLTSPTNQQLRNHSICLFCLLLFASDFLLLLLAFVESVSGCSLPLFFISSGGSCPHVPFCKLI